MDERIKISITESQLAEALQAWSKNVMTDKQVTLLYESHRTFSQLYKLFDPSPNLHIQTEQYSNLCRLRGIEVE